MLTLQTYLTFKGNCEQAFDFYKQVFDGEFDMLQRFSDMPASEGFELPEEMKDKIMHVSLRINHETTLLGSDAGGGMGPETIIGNNFSLALTVESKSEADSLFAALSEGGQVIMPMNQTFWGSYYGMCVDKFGIAWMISYNSN